MSGFLLDTNIISELVKPKPEPKVVIWIDSVDENLLHLSVLTLGEIRKGIASLRDASRRVTLEAWLDSDLISAFCRADSADRSRGGGPLGPNRRGGGGQISAPGDRRSAGGHGPRSEPHACHAEHQGCRRHGRSGLQSLGRLNSLSQPTM